MAASKYPDDFDGIAAAAPTLRWSDVMMKGLSNQMALDDAPTLTHAKLGTVFEAVLARCDAKDGVVDGLLADPSQCDFDPVRDLPRCTGAVNDSCFTEAETTALAKIRQGPTIKGRNYFPQYPGMEEASTARTWIRNPDGSPNVLTVFGESYMKYMFFLPEQDPDYDWKTFDFDTDPDRMTMINDLWNPKPTLEAFKARNGKILTYWGLADAALNPIMGTDYYAEVADRMGGVEQVQDFYRMYMVPGVAHCSGGYGPDEIDAMTPLIEWVEAGKTPDRLLAQKTVDGQLKYNRAICPHPQATVYQSGDPELPESYTCVSPGDTPDEPAPGEDEYTGGGGGCTVSASARDASLPVLVLMALAGVLYRRRGRKQH